MEGLVFGCGKNNRLWLATHFQRELISMERQLQKDFDEVDLRNLLSMENDIFSEGLWMLTTYLCWSDGVTFVTSGVWFLRGIQKGFTEAGEN